MRSRILALTLLLPLFACSDDDNDSNVNPPAGGEGTLTILATDAPFPYEIVTSAKITVDRVSVHADANEEQDGFIVIYDGPPREVDLFALRDGLTTELADADLPSGEYRQIRVRITAAEISLVNGDEFSTALGNLQLASQATSGFKVFVSPPISIQDGVSRTFLLDFDLTNTFRPIPASDPLDATSYSLNPVIHVSNVATSGQIRGDVVTGTPPTPVANATVYLFAPGIALPDFAAATTATNAAGQFTLLGVLPGTYDVVAIKAGNDDIEEDVQVTAGSAADVELVLP